MSFIVYIKNKNGSIYAYEAFSYRDPKSKVPRQKRVYLGKVDPETNSIIPKKVRKDASVGVSDSDPELHSPQNDADTEAMHMDISQQYLDTLTKLQKQNRILINALDQISTITSNISRELKEIDLSST